MTKLVLACEHASRRVPPGVDLGVDQDVLDSHVAWDPGAFAIAAIAQRALNVPLFAGTFTRLFVDLNRAEDHPDVIPETLFDVPIPGNRVLSPQQRLRRLARHHRPFRTHLSDTSARFIAAGHQSAHLAIHSFTPILGHQFRHFDVGIMYDPDRWLDRVVGEALLEDFARFGYTTRANEPYHGVGPGNTTWLRGLFGPRDFAGITIEFSHTVIAMKGGISRAGRALCEVAGSLRKRNLSG